MNTEDNFDLENPTPEQQQRINNLFAEIRYLNPEQWLALDNPDLMTQDIFNNIQLLRMMHGPELDHIAMNIFFQYPDFATNYAERLDRAINHQLQTLDNSDSAISNQYERIYHGILMEFGYDINCIGDIQKKMDNRKDAKND